MTSHQLHSSSMSDLPVVGLCRLGVPPARPGGVVRDTVGSVAIVSATGSADSVPRSRSDAVPDVPTVHKELTPPSPTEAHSRAAQETQRPQPSAGVLMFWRSGGPGWIRTNDLTVISRAL